MLYYLATGSRIYIKVSCNFWSCHIATYVSQEIHESQSLVVSSEITDNKFSTFDATYFNQHNTSQTAY